MNVKSLIMKVPFNDLSRIHDPLRQSFHDVLDQILDTSAFVNDTTFADEFKKYTGSSHCVSCNSGTDALYIAIKALELEPRSKIAVPAISYAATAMAVINAGHVPVFIDVDPETGLMLVDNVYEVDCVIPVHLYGQCVDVSKLLHLNIPIIEDCAQAQGAIVDGKHVGTRGVIGCFSFYPGKNLGALGDAGACITNDEELAARMKRYASLGSPKNNRYTHTSDGINSRMDGVQGLFLCEKLKHLDDWTNDRIRIGEMYRSDTSFPKRSPIGRDVYHVFYTLQDNRDKYIKYMNNRGVQTGIHYPIALPDLECFKKFYTNCENARVFCQRCVSLPIFPYMTNEEVKFTLDCHKSFFRQEL
jgi:dTDP-4-amino-4,6-dideoxygalactose transaminase